MFRFTLIITGLLFCFASYLDAQEEGISHSIEDAIEDAIEDSIEVYEDLFGKEEALNLTLKADFKTFRKTRSKGEYHDAIMSCLVSDSIKLSKPVRMRARGIYRKANCSIPPIWLNIRYSGISSEELSGIRRIKMVTECRSGDHYADYLLREYLAYKIYNLVTPYSFRVRLINLKMIDTGRDNKETLAWAFLIEPTELMAYRSGTEEIQNDMLAMRTVNQEAMDRLAMFQYMIGNPDYSVTGRHNLKILSTKTSGPSDYIPVPYDFDFTGFVNANYAIPNETFGLTSLRERYFAGPCRDRQSYEKAIASLQVVRDEIEATIWAFDLLDEEQRFDMIGYIESFFNTADNEHFIDRELSTTCK